MKMKYLELLDTTLRDGEQMKGVSFTPREKFAIAVILLKELNIDRLEICSARVSRGELAAAKKICRWARKNACLEKIEILGFVDNEKSIDWVNQAGGAVLNLLVKGSLKHLQKQIGRTASEHISDIKAVFLLAKNKKIKINVYLEDWSNGIKDSPSYVFELTKNLIRFGAQRIMLADTLGVLLPDETHKYVKLMAGKFPNAHFDFHCHNDYGLATANSLRAIEAGAKGVHATINGLGERAGNTHLAEIAVLVNDRTDFRFKINEKFLAEASKLVERFSGIRVSVNKPIVGDNVFTQTAGIHADGDEKGNLYTSKLSSERFGREKEYALGKLSGRASLEQNLKKMNIELTKNEKKKVLDEIIELGDRKHFVATTDLPFLISELLGNNLFKKAIKITNVKVSSGLNLTPLAAVSIKIGEKKYSASATGSGAYDAFMNALKKIFTDQLGLKLPELEDYEVSIPPGGRSDALVEAKISWRKNGKYLTTIGVDPDQVMASIRATEKMLNWFA